MRIELHIPRSWADLTEKQLILVCRILSIPDRTKTYLQILALKSFTGLKVIRYTNPGTFLCSYKGKRHEIESWQIHYHLKKLAWLTESPSGLKPLSKLGKQKPLFYTMEGAPLKMYLAAENYYQAFLYTHEPEYLFRLTSVLYSANRVATWQDADTKEYLKDFRKCKPYELLSVFLWYQSIKIMLASRFEYLFSSVGEKSQETEVLDMRKHINNMLRALTGGDVTKMDAVMNTETWYALNELNEKAREVEELKSKT